MTTKVVFLFLVLVGVAFFFTIYVGAQRNEGQPLPDSDTDRASYAQSHPAPGWIGKLIGPLSPKLNLPRKEFQFGASYLEIKVPRASSRFRNATFRVSSGCRTAADCGNVEIVYESNDGEGHDLKLDKQAWQPPTDKPDQASLVILEGGGTIRFRCTVTPECTAELQ